LNQSIALLLSLIIEVPIVWWLCSSRVDIRIDRVLIVAICATVLTHPRVWWLNDLLTMPLSFLLRAGIVEAGAIVIEAIVYRLTLELAWRSKFPCVQISYHLV
jgi:hypothetical protein